MTQLSKKMVLLSFFASGLALNLNSVNAFGQTIPAPSSTASGSGESNPHYSGHHDHKRGFLLVVCVGQTLAAATPPVVLQPGQKPDKSTWVMIKAAKQNCRAAIKAAHGATSGSSSS